MTANEKSEHRELHLGPLQREVLEYVWDHPGCTARDCVDAFNTRDGKQYAYTTIKTVFDVLHKKKLVTRRRTKTAYHFTPRQSRVGLFQQRLNELLGRFHCEPQPVASSLVDALQDDDPEQLQALIDELRKRGHIE